MTNGDECGVEDPNLLMWKYRNGLQKMPKDGNGERPESPRIRGGTVRQMVEEWKRDIMPEADLMRQYVTTHTSEPRKLCEAKTTSHRTGFSVLENNPRSNSTTLSFGNGNHQHNSKVFIVNSRFYQEELFMEVPRTPGVIWLATFNLLSFSTSSIMARRHPGAT
ncbi:hypothetical protein BDZ89DRAFT_1117614 [Hymenopellis radicata]|nr:hypothetical protein BDZ89DRAFT_1117614 [Hymenopellis radicata]